MCFALAHSQITVYLKFEQSRLFKNRWARTQTWYDSQKKLIFRSIWQTFCQRLWSKILHPLQIMCWLPRIIMGFHSCHNQKVPNTSNCFGSTQSMTPSTRIKALSCFLLRKIIYLCPKLKDFCLVAKMKFLHHQSILSLGYIWKVKHNHF